MHNAFSLCFRTAIISLSNWVNLFLLYSLKTWLFLESIFFFLWAIGYQSIAFPFNTIEWKSLKKFSNNKYSFSFTSPFVLNISKLKFSSLFFISYHVLLCFLQLEYLGIRWCGSIIVSECKNNNSKTARFSLFADGDKRMVCFMLQPIACIYCTVISIVLMPVFCLYPYDFIVVLRKDERANAIYIHRLWCRGLTYILFSGAGCLLLTRRFIACYIVLPLLDVK